MFMNTIILSHNSPNFSGGRPAQLGGLFFDDSTGRRALFMGYDPEGRKVGVGERDLEECLKKNRLNYKVKVEIVKETTQFNIARFLARFLIPKPLKIAVKEELDRNI